MKYISIVVCIFSIIYSICIVSCIGNISAKPDYYPLVSRPGIEDYVLVQSGTKCSLYRYGLEPSFDTTPPRIPQLNVEIPVGAKCNILVCNIIPMELFYPSIISTIELSGPEWEFMSPLVAVEIDNNRLLGYYEVSKSDMKNMLSKHDQRTDYKSVRIVLHHLDFPIEGHKEIGVFDGYAYNFIITYGAKYVFLPASKYVSEELTGLIDAGSIPTESLYYCVEAAYLRKGKASTLYWLSKYKE